MVAKIRPWSKGSEAKSLVVDGDWVDVKWGDSFTSAHECVYWSDLPGFFLTYHGTRIWTPLSSVEFRKINSKYRPNTKLAASPPKKKSRGEQSALDAYRSKARSNFSP